MRRPKPLHPAALLIHQDRRLPADGGAEIVDQAAQRLGTGNVPLEDDEAPWLGFAEKSALLVGQAQTGNSGDECAHCGAD